ncbi:hypothetical protein GCM10010377_01680 [Streptomyces viridiviolaceus]|nr:hypothetical protein GCM10010377_01680 [Streptomyces viridiviolaceus]
MRTVARGLVRMAPWPFGCSGKGQRDSPDACRARAVPANGPGTGVAGCGEDQAGVTDIRYRPRSGYRTDEDTRITVYRERGAATAVR